MKAENIAAYIQEATGISDEWKLQKLVYYANAWALVWTGRPLVSDSFEAWRDGPVSRNLYVATHHSPPPLEVKPLSHNQKRIVDAVLDSYGDMSKEQLVEQTHKEAPWREARTGLPAGAPSQRLLNTDTIARFYALEATTGRGPAAPSLAYEPVDDAEVDESIRQVSQQWAEALARLEHL